MKSLIYNLFVIPSPEAPRLCRMCGQLVTRWRDLVRHIVRHTPELWK